LNLTNQLLLSRMAEGSSLEAAMAEARTAGILEADPSLDVDGWDAAAKILILARAVLGLELRLEDVVRKSLRDVPSEAPRQARAEGRRWIYLQTAECREGRWHLTAGPSQLEADHPWSHLRPDEAAVRYTSDDFGQLDLRWAGQGPLGTAAALWRDLFEVMDLEARRTHP